MFPLRPVHSEVLDKWPARYCYVQSTEEVLHTTVLSRAEVNIFKGSYRSLPFCLERDWGLGRVKFEKGRIHAGRYTSGAQVELSLPAACSPFRDQRSV